jgi:hypothetical protein
MSVRPCHIRTTFSHVACYAFSQFSLVREISEISSFILNSTSIPKKYISLNRARVQESLSIFVRHKFYGFFCMNFAKQNLIIASYKIKKYF